MYLTNKYTTWYYNIITNASQRVNQTGYTEKHHIIPKSLGGSNDPSNLVRLTAKEHFICHRLLVKMTEGNNKRKMANAAWCMVHLKNPYQDGRYRVTSNIYASLKPYMKRSPEVIERVRAKLKGRKKPPRTSEHSAKLGRYVRTEEHRKAISDARKAQKGLQKRGESALKNMSAWQKGIPKPKFKCEHCGKEVSLTNHIRWHGDKCKSKSTDI